MKTNVIVLSILTLATTVHAAPRIEKQLSELRSADGARKLVGTLSEGDARRGQAIRTLFYQQLARGDVKQAGEILKSAPGDNLSWARLKYQAGDFVEAVRYYEAIPKNSDDYVRSREELGWAYLRKGDWSGLRGLLAHLNTDLIPVEERLEGRVLSAISYLKQCHYDGVKREIQAFQQELAPLARKLDDLEKTKREAAPARPDYFTRQVAATVDRLKSEPGSDRELAESRRVLEREYARTWVQLKPLVTEAVLKMRYVKLELLSQLQWLEKMRGKGEVLTKNGQVADLDTESAKAAIVKADSERLVFPVQKDIWVDELFNVRALATTECENLQQQRGKM